MRCGTSSKKTCKIWLWRACDAVTGKIIAWTMGKRDDHSLRVLVNKIGLEDRTFVTDDWEGYHRVIPADQLFTGKDLTAVIERDNSNVRHCLGRFHRRTKIVSKCATMVDLSLRLLHHLQEPKNFAAYASKIWTIFA